MPAELAISYSTLYAFLLVFARVAGALTFVPLPGISRGPAAPRIALALSLTAALYPAWPAAAEPSGVGQFAAWLAAEAALGITAGLAIAFLLEVLAVAFQTLGLQAGYSYASTIDPTTEADSSVLLVFAQLMSGLLFFALGLDREVLRVFAASLLRHPPGSYAPGATELAALTGLGGAMLATGLRLALPVVVLLLLVDFALALLGRMHQQLQLLSLAFPAKMLAALALLAAVLVVFLPVWRAAAERTLAAMGRML
jgi:flagellar biosynthetic protein FliR